MSQSSAVNAQKAWNFFNGKGLNDYACAGILGNAYAESGILPNNLQDSYQKTLGMSDEEYTKAVDSGSYSNFANDRAGYGLFQFTYWTLKQGLLEHAKKTKRSIGDLEMQLEYTWTLWERDYSSMMKILRSAQSVRAASDAVLLRFERPYDRGESVQIKRASLGETYYNKFATSPSTGGIRNKGYITTKKGQAVKLSAYFNSTEMDCHGSGCCSQTIINETLVDYLTKIREHFGKPITITSGYRCATHNRNVGGATGSRHSKGDAADIVVSGVTPRAVAQYAESIGILGIGLYETSSDGHFVHIDTRNYKSFWYGQAQAARTTFGGSTSTTGSSTTTGQQTTSSSTVLTIGAKGEAVKQLQQNLITLGYSCGARGADGDFGAGTFSAVRKFQDNNGLSVDGIAGTKTLAAISSALQKATGGKQVKVTASLLNVRSGAGTTNTIVATVKKGTICIVTEEKDGWGKIQSPAGWISSQYYENV